MTPIPQKPNEAVLRHRGNLRPSAVLLGLAAQPADPVLDGRMRGEDRPARAAAAERVVEVEGGHGPVAPVRGGLTSRDLLERSEGFYPLF